MSRTYIVVASVLLLSTVAHADPADRTSRRRRHDYSRFSDGPRNVPTARGASLTRARALDLGTREAASRAIHQTPSARALRAAAWRGETVDRLLWPVDGGRYVRGFGYVRRTRPELRHDGVDIAAESGTIVRAAANGIVVYSDNGIRGFGNCVILLHPNGWVSLYAHNSQTTVQAGWRVHRGERIALVGTTGISRGPHVHFELFENGANIDPLALFDGGPAFVRRVAARAFRMGRVAEPRALTALDRRMPRAASARRESAAETAPTGTVAPAAPASGEPRGLGTRRLLRRLHRFAPSPNLLAHATGRRFRNLLWPVRGGRVIASSRRRMLVDATDAPLRADADGLVVYASRGTISLLHPMGWVTTYRGVAAIQVRVGSSVERGAWIARGDSRVQIEVRVDGRRVAPLERFVRVPADDID